MNLFSELFSGIGVTLIGNLTAPTYKYAWLLEIISNLIGLVSDVGLGIILFTVALKLITLPLDIFSRASMKKNSLKMEMMRDDLEKLQKQYANNKQLYQQKMMALYKKNGYSALMPCLPTIVTLVFFIIVIGAFNSYTKKADFEVFQKMGAAYDSEITLCIEEGSVIKPDEEKDEYYVNVEKALSEKYADYFVVDKTVSDYRYNIYRYTITEEGANALKSEYEKELSSFFSENGGYNYENEKINGLISSLAQDRFVKNCGVELSVLGDSVKKSGSFYVINNGIKLKELLNGKEYSSFLSEEGIFDYNSYLTDEEKSTVAERAFTDESLSLIVKEYKSESITGKARIAAKECYENNRSKSVVFPWVKNLWQVDSPFKPAIPDYDNLKTTLGANCIQEGQYKELTAELGEYRSTGFGKGNGWYVLVALSILTMLASTLIMNKTQKTQMELSSVEGANGTAAMQQKMMTWMMPVMFGIFAFIYSAGFSIYMVTSSILSTVFTLLINFCVEKSFKNKINKQISEENSKARYGKRR